MKGGDQMWYARSAAGFAEMVIQVFNFLANSEAAVGIDLI